LDDKNRVTIPSAWRAGHVDEDVFLATPHPDGFIAILPPSEVEKLHEKVSQIPLSDGSGQEFVAHFFSQTQNIWFDSQGRVMLNAELLRHAGIGKDAVLVGTLAKFHVYSAERWNSLEQRATSQTNRESMRRMGI